MSIIERGKFIRDCADPRYLAFFDENKALVAYLYENYRMEWVLGRDGKHLSTQPKDWICHGSGGQVWEFGAGKLGITVQGTKRVSSFIRQTSDFCAITQNGDGEANLKCAWTAHNVAILATLLKLHKSPKIRSEAQKAVLMANLKILNARREAVGGTQDTLKVVSQLIPDPHAGEPSVKG